MIIEKIELENFMCYAGKNILEFKEGINVIIGDNGYGKSKLYDAFYWVMYDQVFSTEKKIFENTKIVKSGIISDKAKTETPNGRVTCMVKITFKNVDRGNFYILERKYTINTKDGVIKENNDSEFTVMKKDLSYLNARMVTDEEEKNKIRERILPPPVKDYLWFQGEQVESIIDFNKQDTLTKAINVLSSITRYDQIKALAIVAAKTGNNEYDREVKRLSKDADKSEQLEIEKKQLEGKIQRYQDEETEVKENLSRAEEKCEVLLNKIGDATTVSELQQRKKGLLSQLVDLNQLQKEEQISFHRKMFRSKWVLKGTAKLHTDYSEQFSKYENLKLEAAADIKAKQNIEEEIAKKLQFRLPLDVPEPIYVQRMLDAERCLVCDREAKENSDPWNRIKELIDRPDRKNTSNLPEPVKHDFSADLKRLYQNGLALVHRIDELDEDINETLTKIANITTRIRQVNKQIEKVEEEIQKLLSDTSLSAETAENIIAEYSIQNKYVKDFSEQLNALSQKLENSRSTLRDVNDKLAALVDEIPKSLIEKREILNDFEAMAISTRERVFNQLILQLENEANKHYEAMTAGNKSVKGQIKLRKLPNGNYMPEIIDDSGKPLLGSNTSNLILVKLSAIMAIISAKSSSGLVDLYTLITDAPTSVFGEDYTIGFCKTISKVYKQSIIMSKEFYKNQNLKNELLSNPEIKIGKVYTITPSIIETERNNRNNLFTKVELDN
ncbi:AAA family ATPase [Chryseolinea soli]|uniref:Rad50/SbcC-type AAA domain-containing protein n=1 Tax=Chryseolinea soli TaxID=2321403 RepID=A0A385SLZ0_9BACT|nr:AAA family ATPase [Chryseolinea soli]AYB31984.1 hypothetical protein D4L85_16055 [Chryseolinea soli]